MNIMKVMSLVQGKGEELLTDIERLAIKRIDSEFNVGFDRAKIAVNLTMQDIVKYLKENEIL